MFWDLPKLQALRECLLCHRLELDLVSGKNPKLGSGNLGSSPSSECDLGEVISPSKAQFVHL